MKLTQPLTRNQLAHYWNQREQLFSQARADLSAVQEIDSIGLAFLVQWSQSLAAELRPLTLDTPPANFLPLVDLYGVGEFFASTNNFTESSHES
ncbi:STAS domain-containing protein [Oceanisphaera avium]|uniref:Anti-anti-sigma factor n=1 Tax=Oceanisphaera avium TaxID=1903694 RepID=A0A1Y0CZR4_9GAMM|nr:STAS domain-containing protein [Oceanisphaera avium]ART80820.1 anti-anti-sigma factor [Oceanisphaera avium]